MDSNDDRSEKDNGSSGQGCDSSRREFLHQAAAGALGLASATGIAGDMTAAAFHNADAAALLPAIKLGLHRVTRLIIGGNPIYGYSHFNRLLSQHQTEWHTPERVVELLKRCEAAGINTWQNSHAERTVQDLDRYRAAGGTMHWLCLGKPDWDQNPEIIKEVAGRKPIGIAPHGSLAERLHRQGRHDVLRDLLKRIRDAGVLVGLSAHNPELVALSEEKNWDVDYYMCCLYYLTRPREEFKKLLGENLPLGEIYLPSDPPRMFKTIQAARRPCLAYKVLAAGRRIGSPTEVRACFELGNLTKLSFLQIGYNALYTNDSSLISFLNSNSPPTRLFHDDPGWQETQTIAPACLRASPQSASSIEVSWTPIAYSSDSGRYIVLQSTVRGGPYSPAGSTADKRASSLTVTGLRPSTTYYFVVRTVTDPHLNTRNTVASEFSSEVSAATY